MSLIRLHSFICIIVLLTFSGLYAGNVQGTISDLSDNTPVHPACVTLILLYYFLAESPLPVEPQIYAVINNPDGSYMVENIPSDDYMMICSAQLYKWQRIEAINLTDQEVTADFFLEKLDPAVNNLINGTIYEYPTRALVLPLVNVYLTCTDPNLERPDILHYCLSDRFGHYQFYDLYSGLGTLEFSKPGYELLTDSLKISTDTWLTEQDYWMKPLSPPLFGHITGNVHFDKLNEPVAGASISFLLKYTDATQTNAVYNTRTDVYGNYEMLLPEDEYIVSCQYCGPDVWYFYQEYYDDVHSIADALPVTVKAGEVVTDIDFGIPYPAIVSNVTFKGNVSDQEGNALANSLVNVHPYDLTVPAYGAADNVYQTWTDDQGNYILEINLYWFTIPTPVLGFIVSACKDGYLTEFYQEKKTAYEADILWAFSDTTFAAINFTLDNVNEIQAISGTISSEGGGMIFQAFVIGVHAPSGENTLPAAYRLYRNYPNPFNPLTHIRFDLPDKRNVSLVIYDILGHPVRELLNSFLPAGTYTYTWDGTDQQGHSVSSGIYFYVLQSQAEKRVGKMILQK